MMHICLQEAVKGAITYNLSAVGLRPSMVPAPVYAASKHAVVGFIRAWGVSKLRHKWFIFSERDTPYPNKELKRVKETNKEGYRKSFTEKLLN